MIKPDGIRNIINDDSFKEAMDQLVKIHLDMIINSSPDQGDIREVAYQRISTVNEIMSHLQSIADEKKIDDSRWNIT
tara:strand:- start:43 stop:273 length:231 start_codon:yes stop_codon:yes gene_type:complete